MRKEIGTRLKQIRASRTQPAMADELGVAHRTYAGYERGEAEIGAEPLAALVSQGWNVNWLLAGTGPERLDQLVDRDAEEAAGFVSQPMQQAHVSIAFQLIDEVVDELARQSKPALSPEKRAAMFTAMYGLLSEGMSTAKVLHFARAAAA